MSVKVQDEKPRKITWGKDASKREAKVRFTFQVPESLGSFIVESGAPSDFGKALDEFVESSGISLDKALDAVHEWYKMKALRRVTGKALAYKNGEPVTQVTTELLALAQESPFVSLRPRSEAFRVKSALETIRERGEAAKAAGRDLPIEEILAIIAKAKIEEASAE